MRKFFHSRSLYISIALIVITIVLLMVHEVGSKDKTPLVTTSVETGPVRELVSVSGIAKAKQTAELAFPVTGIIQTVHVKIGDEVKTGDTLITLDSRAFYADRQDAVASLARAMADKEELLEGPTLSARDVTTETVAVKQSALDTTITDETQKVTNARRALLSSNLSAYSNKYDEDAVPPTISGTYSCDTEGTYNIELYSSSANSGYSYYLTGIETGTYVASTDQPIPLGNCGLRIKFDPTSKYSRSSWQIDIPNTKSSQYTTYRNAYLLAVSQAESAISTAENALALAEASAINQNAPARDSAVARANSVITQAQAQLSRIDSTIADRILVAPFNGTITEIDILPGETVTSAPVITLLASNEFEVTARIPEIDIGKISTGQKVDMLFDARSGEIITGEISFISLKSTEIDGVSYYEAIIELDEVPPWIRSGLNADIEIIIQEESNSLRIPKRFVTKTESGYEVLIQAMKNATWSTTTIEVVLEGNDGYYAITGLTEGTVLLAP